MTSRNQGGDAARDTRRAQESMHGMAALFAGHDELTVPTVALWHVAVSGAFTGAWIMPRAYLNEPDTARRALILLERRALLVWDPESALFTLAELINAAHLPAAAVQPWREHLYRVPAALIHIRTARDAHAAVLEEQPTSIPLQWQLDLPATTPADSASFLRAVRRTSPRTASPVVTEALELAAAARWCLQAWQETESVRGRRAVLRQQFGLEQPAPPPWIAALHAQHSQKLNLEGERIT